MRGETTATRGERAQSNVVGVALLLGATVIALGALTASVGALVDGHAARSDAQRVAQDLDDAIRPVETTGYRRGEVRFASGQLRTVDRQLRVFDSGGLVANLDVGGLVFEHGDRRVAAVAGGVVRGSGDEAWTVDPPPVVGSDSTDVLVVGAATLNASDQAVGGDGVTARLATNVSHDRRTLGTDTYRVAVETEAPGAFERVFEDRGATVTRRDIDGDGVPSVVAQFPGSRRAYLVEHDLRLEVNGG
jgi:hypothetical protein